MLFPLEFLLGLRNLRVLFYVKGHALKIVSAIHSINITSNLYKMNGRRSLHIFISVKYYIVDRAI